MLRRLLRVALLVLPAARALRVPATRRAFGVGAGAALAGAALPAPGRAAEEPPIDMDKIRALAAKKQTMDLRVPTQSDPRDRALKLVVLASNGAVLRLEPDEVKEMERVGFLVKDGFRGRAPDYLSLRDFQPRDWYSAPLSSVWENGVDRFKAVSDGRDYTAEVEAKARALRTSVAEKAAAVGGDLPPEGWLAPVRDDGTICGYGRYATKCADPTPGQAFIKNAVEGASPKGIAPPEKLVFTPLVETLSKKFAGAK